MCRVGTFLAMLNYRTFKYVFLALPPDCYQYPHISVAKTRIPFTKWRMKALFSEWRHRLCANLSPSRFH